MDKLHKALDKVDKQVAEMRDRYVLLMNCANESKNYHQKISEIKVP